MRSNDARAKWIGFGEEDKKTRPKTRTMIISGYEIEPGELKIDINSGIIDKIIQKPISINGLRREVKNQINDYQLTINKK